MRELVLVVILGSLLGCHPNFEVRMSAMEDESLKQWREDITKQVNDNTLWIEEQKGAKDARSDTTI